MNEMEVLALASLTIKDLAVGAPKGLKAEVIVEAKAHCGLAGDEEVESHREALAEIHQGQRDLAKLGWHRAPKFLVERMWNPNHNVIRAAWFKNDHEKEETYWILCQITERFGLRAVFSTKDDLGGRIIGREELRSICEAKLEELTEGDNE